VPLSKFVHAISSRVIRDEPPTAANEQYTENKARALEFLWGCECKMDRLPTNAGTHRNDMSTFEKSDTPDLSQNPVAAITIWT
jgi:hypothetical protein